MRLVEREWLTYRNKVIPSDAGATQLQECRRAFYAGAHALFERILVALAPEYEVTEEDIKMMDGVRNELRAFNESVKAGTA